MARSDGGRSNTAEQSGAGGREAATTHEHDRGRTSQPNPSSTRSHPHHRQQSSSALPDPTGDNSQGTTGSQVLLPPNGTEVDGSWYSRTLQRQYRPRHDDGTSGQGVPEHRGTQADNGDSPQRQDIDPNRAGGCHDGYSRTSNQGSASPDTSPDLAGADATCPNTAWSPPVRERFLHAQDPWSPELAQSRDNMAGYVAHDGRGQATDARPCYASTLELDNDEAEDASSAASARRA